MSNDIQYKISSEGKPTLIKTQSEIREILGRVYSDDSIDLILLGAEIGPKKLNRTQCDPRTFEPINVEFTIEAYFPIPTL